MRRSVQAGIQTVLGAGLLGILRMAVETRRTALVDLSLDLIQKLIAHGHLAGSVYNISHKRDPAAGRSGRKASCDPAMPPKIKGNLQKPISPAAPLDDLLSLSAMVLSSADIA